MPRTLLVLALVFTAVSAAPMLFIDFLRHGARSPTNDLPYFKNVTWKYQGELTPVGQRQHYLLGRLRRQQYIEGSMGKLLPETYDPKLIYARSSFFNRTMMSLQSYLLGLYPTGQEPLNTAQVAHRKDLLAPPIPLTIGQELVDQLMERTIPNGIPMHAIHTVVSKVEHLFFPLDCRYAVEASDEFSEKKYAEIVQRFEQLWKDIIAAHPEISMEFIKTGGNTQILTDFLLCAEAEGMKPYKITGAIIEGCKEFLGTVLKEELGYTPQLVKIAMYDITREVLARMNATLEGKSPVKYAVYSGHDITLTILLGGLHEMNKTISWTKTPYFASNIAFELSDGKDHVVTVYYDGQIIHQEPYEEFKKKFADVGDLKMSREAACAQPLHNSLRPGSSPVQS